MKDVDDIKMTEQQLYEIWCEKARDDEAIVKELESIKDDSDAIYERFYKDLEFGTGGMRGEMGAGTNRMNIYTVAKIAQAMAEHINGVTSSGSAVICYDSRNNSTLFAKRTASVLAANGVKTYIFKELAPTPVLSYAVRYLKCNAGAMITASHNPAKYNGFKAYGSDGCQLGLEESRHIMDIIDTLDIFDSVKCGDFEQLMKDGMIEYVRSELFDSYYQCVLSCMVDKSALSDGGLSVIYTPLNGTGNKPVREALALVGIKDLRVVPEQEKPDGNFPTTPFPNPEFRESFECAIRLADERPADILLATDPDCDRVGAAVKEGGEYVLLNGDEMGIIMLDYILKNRQAGLKRPVCVKTIVTSRMTDKVAQEYGCEVIDVLTGFKFIGEQIALLESKGDADRYVLGFEESYGYLPGTYVRDKDAVAASLLLAEIAAVLKREGRTLAGYMDSLYKEYGYYTKLLINSYFEGSRGMAKMKAIMEDLRENPPAEIGGTKIVSVSDYLTGTCTSAGHTSELTLPKSDVLAYKLEDGADVIIRPSGTEPKIKVYIISVSSDRETSRKEAERLGAYMDTLLAKEH